MTSTKIPRIIDNNDAIKPSRITTLEIDLKKARKLVPIKNKKSIIVKNALNDKYIIDISDMNLINATKTAIEECIEEGCKIIFAEKAG